MKTSELLGFSHPMQTRRGLKWESETEVLIVTMLKSGEVILHEGHITSWPFSHGTVDNVERVVVWRNVAFREADSADDAHERTFMTSDPHLLQVSEARMLQFLPFCLACFDMHDRKVIDKICMALREYFMEWDKRAECAAEERSSANMSRLAVMFSK